MKFADEHFGVPMENRISAIVSATRLRKRSYHSYVPTRSDVASLSYDDLSPLLINWMTRSSIEIVPSRSQIAEVRKVLEAREDATAFKDLIETCDCYISGKRNDSMNDREGFESSPVNLRRPPVESAV